QGVRLSPLSDSPTRGLLRAGRVRTAVTLGKNFRRMGLVVCLAPFSCLLLPTPAHGFCPNFPENLWQNPGLPIGNEPQSSSPGRSTPASARILRTAALARPGPHTPFPAQVLPQHWREARRGRRPASSHEFWPACRLQPLSAYQTVCLTWTKND